MLLAQVAADTAAVLLDTLGTASQAEPDGSLGGGLRLLFQGGWSMIPILLLSVIAVAIFVERLLALGRAKGDPQRLTQSVGDYVQRGDLAGAIAYCRDADTPAARIVQRGLERLGRPIDEIKEAVGRGGAARDLPAGEADGPAGVGRRHRADAGLSWGRSPA